MTTVTTPSQGDFKLPLLPDGPLTAKRYRYPIREIIAMHRARALQKFEVVSNENIDTESLPSGPRRERASLCLKESPLKGYMLKSKKRKDPAPKPAIPIINEISDDQDDSSSYPSSNQSENVSPSSGSGEGSDNSAASEAELLKGEKDLLEARKRFDIMERLAAKKENLKYLQDRIILLNRELEFAEESLAQDERYKEFITHVAEVSNKTRRPDGQEGAETRDLETAMKEREDVLRRRFLSETRKELQQKKEAEPEDQHEYTTTEPNGNSTISSQVEEKVDFLTWKVEREKERIEWLEHQLDGLN